MKNRVVLIIIAVLLILMGIWALFNPVAGSLAVETLAGWAFLVLGAMQLFFVFSETTWGARLWALLWGVLAVIAGIDLLAHPLDGLITLTYLLAIVFIVSGIFKLIAGFGPYAGSWRWLVLLSGAVSLLLGIMILSNFLASAMVTLGLLLGLQLISDGASLLGLVLAVSEDDARTI